MATQLRVAGIPYDREVSGLVPGRRYRVDFFVSPNIVVECQGGLFRSRRTGRRGAGHTSTAQMLRDMEKSNELTCAGYQVLHVAAPHVRDGRALRWVERARIDSKGSNSPQNRRSTQTQSPASESLSIFQHRPNVPNGTIRHPPCFSQGETPADDP